MLFELHSGIIASRTKASEGEPETVNPAINITQRMKEVKTSDFRGRASISATGLREPRQVCKDPQEHAGPGMSLDFIETAKDHEETLILSVTKASLCRVEQETWWILGKDQAFEWKLKYKY